MFPLIQPFGRKAVKLACLGLDLREDFEEPREQPWAKAESNTY